MSKRKEKILEFVELDQHTSIQKLPLKDQMRVFMKRLLYNERNELKRESVSSVDYLRKKANFTEFLTKATEPIREGKYTSVELSVSSKFEDVLMEVLYAPNIDNYYHIEVIKPQVKYNTDYFFTIKLQVKGGD